MGNIKIKLRSTTGQISTANAITELNLIHRSKKILKSVLNTTDVEDEDMTKILECILEGDFSQTEKKLRKCSPLIKAIFITEYNSTTKKVQELREVLVNTRVVDSSLRNQKARHMTGVGARATKFAEMVGIEYDEFKGVNENEPQNGVGFDEEVEASQQRRPIEADGSKYRKFLAVMKKNERLASGEVTDFLNIVSAVLPQENELNVRVVNSLSELLFNSLSEFFRDRTILHNVRVLASFESVGSETSVSETDLTNIGRAKKMLKRRLKYHYDRFNAGFFPGMDIVRFRNLNVSGMVTTLVRRINTAFIEV